MPPAAHLAAFAAVSFVLIIVPGPNVLFVISRSLTQGRRAGVSSAVGGQLGVFMQVIAVAIGLGAVIERSVTLFDIAKVAGGLYLMYLGVQALRHRHSLKRPLTGIAERKATTAILRDGFVVGVSNPKAAVFMAAVLPQFADSAAGHLPEQMLVLGCVFMMIAVVCDSAWALVAGTAREWFARSPRRLESIGAAGGLVMIGIGASLVLTGRGD